MTEIKFEGCPCFKNKDFELKFRRQPTVGHRDTNYFITALTFLIKQKCSKVYRENFLTARSKF